ncbi:AMP-binding enzyme [Hirsutella rhossiliensis]|uniref:AMP-binding enzyme domain-containing protein n=1 Tax=Hirsutella rhossiliensis TaxID=111463 RepID=A0A9P8MX48_9HYPO|nr:AMP-binding enzyme domain-containing protein [Hirsutella rhossiliensis]KAH0961871.1 AMP-binding enzyme domain-containing protein [Hirsutella rhossiliensis]
MGLLAYEEPARRLEQLLYWRAAEQPDAPAIEDQGDVVDYKTALYRAKTIANALFRAASENDVPLHQNPTVGLCIQRGSSAIVALLGILVAGCCYVPLTLDAGTERLARTFEISGVQIVLTDDASSQALSDKLDDAETGTKPLLLSVQTLLASHTDRGTTDVRLPSTPLENSAAYTLFSSGTTGKPKGITMSHSSVLHYLDASRRTFKTNSLDRWLHAAPYTFDVSLEELFVPLSAGACIVCQPQRGLDSLTGYLEFITTSRITAVSMPTAFWHRLSPHLVDSGESLPSTLRLVVIGGEAARTDAYRHWASAVKGSVELVNAYGPTESCISATFGTRFDLSDTTLNIGRPLPGMKAYVAEHDSNVLVPDGQVGRLLLAGPQLAVGYLSDQTLTATKFVPNPFEEWVMPGYERVYNTGDLVVRKPTGELGFCGRVDLQLQVRGQRVEAEGVESVLAGCASVMEASIIVVEDQGSEAMVAFLVAREGHPEETVLSDAEKSCAIHLIAFEKPSHFVLLEKLPLNSSGKVDKKALAVEWCERRPKAANASVSPVITDTEKSLADLWRQTLSLEPSVQLGRESNLARLGGHSLTMVTLTSKIYNRFNVRVTVPELLRHQQLSDMAVLLESRPASFAGKPSATPDADEVFDLTPSQEQLYLAQSKEPDSPFFNDGVAIEIQGSYDSQLLEAAIRRIVRRHEALRCVLVGAGSAGKVKQRILPLSGSLWESIWNHQVVRPDNLKRVSADLFSIPLDLFSGPLLKIHLLEAENPEGMPDARISVLIVQAHHICWDGFSDGIFLEELNTLYQDPVAALESIVPVVATLDLQSIPAEASITELSDYLRNVPESVGLPTDLAPPQKKSYSRGGVLRFELPATLMRQALASAGRNITPTSLLLTVYAAVLRRFAGGQSDLALGVPMANRVTAETAACIGFFVNMLPLRVQAEEEHRLSDLLDMVEAGLGTLRRNQHVLLADVYRRQQSSSSTHERLLRFCFSFQDAPEGKLADACAFKRWPLHNGAARADLTCFTELCVDGSISGELEYDADLFDRETIASISDCMSCVLQRIASHRAWEIPVGQLTLVETQPKDLLAIGDKTRKHPEDLGAYLLRAVDTCRQNNVAIVDEVSNCCITYEELSRMARHLAHQIHLTASRPGAVLLLLRRSWEVPVSQIASALADRPWICCDVNQPRERVMRIIDDAKPGCIITQSGIDADLPSLSTHGVPIIYPVELFNGPRDAAWDIPQTSREPSLAYVIYTSGTTGTPKGVAIEQQSLIQFLDHIRSWTARPGGPTVFNSILTSNTAFDGSLSQMYSALTTGGRLILAKHGGEQDGEYIAATLSKHEINYLCTTTAAIRLWMSQASQSHPEFFGPRFRCLLLGGDELPPAFLSLIYARSSCPEKVEVKNVYGPTEGTIFSSYGDYRASDLSWLTGRRRSPIDTTLPSAAISIVGPDLRDLPRGAVGEIVIWGSCLAREYLSLPELNAAKFISREKLRGWRTGDLGRWTGSGSGAFEVLGRSDSMRKVLGGFRVDLDEVGLAVASHPEVREAHVSAVDEEDGAGAKQTKVVAHVVLHRQWREQQDLETVSNWRTMFTDVNHSLEEYDDEGIDLGFDYRGWASSFDRSTIPKEDMEEWVNCTVERILDLDCFRGGQKPRVAEIGCGTGMILFRLADKVSSYYGTDLAESTVAQVQQHAGTLGHHHIRTQALPAHEFDSLLSEGEQFDLIICNSVAQYFPSLEYLDQVLRRARNRQAPSGLLFMGDIRHEGLKIHHAVTSAFSRGARTAAALQVSAADILDKDKELQVDPSFFVDRCGAVNRLFEGRARIEWRRGSAPTEMTLFRYDAVLMMVEEAEEDETRLERSVSWGQGQQHRLSDMHTLLPSDTDIMIFQDVPNKRLQVSEHLRRFLDPTSATAGHDAVSAVLESGATRTGWDPEVLVSQVQATGYDALIVPSPKTPVAFDLVVFRPSSLFRSAATSWAFTHLSEFNACSNTTQQPLCSRADMSQLTRRSIFMHLFHKMPRYMIPHYMISVDGLPLAGTGKVNAKLLPAPRPGDLLSGAASPQHHQQESGHSEDPDSKPGAAIVPSDILPLARDIAGIFTEVLGRPCSVHDDFFFSGGHSILAARAVQMMRTRLWGGGLAVPFTAVLAHPTPTALAARLADMRRWQDQTGDLPAPLVLLRPAATIAYSGKEGGNERDEENQGMMMDIVVMHPIGGGLMPMAEFADALGARLRGAARIVGLPWTSSGRELATTRREEEEEEEASSPLTVEALAMRYADILADFISARSRTGRDSKQPLYLLGWSFGGTLAYETGKRIQSMVVEQGQEEETSVRVILLDAPTLDAAVREIDPCALVAENYAEHIIDYVAERTRSSSANMSASEKKKKNKSTAQSQTQSDQVQILTQLLMDSRFDEYTDLVALPPLVRKCYDKSRGIPSWIADADLVESSLGPATV